MSALSKFTIRFVHFRLRFNMVNKIKVENSCCFVEISSFFGIEFMCAFREYTMGI